MIKVFILLFFSLYSTKSFSWKCIKKEPESPFAAIENFNFEQVCGKLNSINNQKELTSTLEFFFNKHKDKKCDNRRDTIDNVNSCLPSEKSKALIIAFEGTNSYEPLSSIVMSDFNKCFGGKLKESLRKSIYPTFLNIFKEQTNKNARYSGLQSGIHKELNFINNGKYVDWFSFPSEETELIPKLLPPPKNHTKAEVEPTPAPAKQLIAPVKKIGKAITQILPTIKQTAKDINNSINLNPLGVQKARECITKYLKEARRLKISPKLIIVSHSSGSQSLIKFAESMRKESDVEFDLAFTIDPVEEAHKAGFRILGKKFKELGKIPILQTKPFDKPRNVKKHENFYQQDDRKGLGLPRPLDFGIHGARVKDANNYEVQEGKETAHGSIPFNDFVIEKWRENLNELLNPLKSTK